tara:strand:+ start:45 stop:221 length:177 start_codon:yes stop_codon:yes gene_type:complete
MYNLIKDTIKEVRNYRTNYINECLIVFNDLNINELDPADIIYYNVLNKEYKKRKETTQ